MTRSFFIICALFLVLAVESIYAGESDLIKTKCYKTEDPVGEVCLFEDRRAVAANKEKYQENCEASAKFSVKTLSQPELRVTDLSGMELDRVKIPYLSTLNLMSLRVNEKKSFYTSYQNSACGSFLGDVQSPFWVLGGKINYLRIENKTKDFLITLRRSWAPVRDGFLEGASWLDDSTGDKWKTSYRRYQYVDGAWNVTERGVAEMTDFSDTPLNEKDFPSRLRGLEARSNGARSTPARPLANR